MDNSINIVKLPSLPDQEAKNNYKLLLNRLNSAIKNFETSTNLPKPRIHLSFEKSPTGALEFHGKVWEPAERETKEYSQFAKELTEAFKKYEDNTKDLHVNIQVLSSPRSKKRSLSSIGIFPRKSKPPMIDSVNEAGTIYRLLAPLWSLDDVIISESILLDISRAVKLIQFEDLIYEQWNMKSVEPFPKCVLNFYGFSGTGKTMAAHAVAHTLGRQLLALNISEIESKYVGESPKNLAGAFQFAETMKAVLFIDEADSLLGKRITNISQGSEQAVNSLRSQILVSLDSFRGVAVFATNVIASYDFAFHNRIRHIKFDLPGITERTRLWRRHLPQNLPLGTEINFHRLAEISDGFSGRDIKNTVILAIGDMLVSSKRTLWEEDLTKAIQTTAKTRDLK